MNPIILIAGIGLAEKLFSNKNGQMFLFGLIAFVLYSLKSAVDTVTGLPAKVMDEINAIIATVYISDNTLHDFENKTGIVKFFTEAWYLNERTKNTSIANLISSHVADAIAEQIYLSDQLNDTEEAVYSALASIPNKISLGFVAHTFKMKYGFDLIVFMKDFLDNLEIMNCYKIVAPLKIS